VQICCVALDWTVSTRITRQAETFWNAIMTVGFVIVLPSPRQNQVSNQVDVPPRARVFYRQVKAEVIFSGTKNRGCGCAVAVLVALAAAAVFIGYKYVYPRWR